jgi:hypothetical protein
MWPSEHLFLGEEHWFTSLKSGSSLCETEYSMTLTWYECAPVCDDINTILSHSSKHLVIIITSKQLILTDTFVLSQNFATLQKTKTISSVRLNDLSTSQKIYMVTYLFVTIFA